MSTNEKKFIVTIEGRNQTFEVPVFAQDLDHAAYLAQDYEDAGFVIDRISPEVDHEQDQVIQMFGR
ncbi:MAG: host cell RNA polymerase inhibitor [Clostridium sp.]|nr:host cell RNA polymerase inhibitor [Clostridium sp.]